MKKIFLFSICTLLMVDNVFATCGQSTLGFDGTQKPKHDEFLYINKNQYDLTVSGYENSNKQNSGSGYGYECDTTHSAGCDKGDEVTLPAGHVFEGNVVNQSVRYVCKGGLNDRWVAQKGTAEVCDTKFGQIPVGKQLDGKTTVDCSGLNKTEENVNLVKTWAVLCRSGRTVVCKPTECIKDYKVNIATGKCDFIGCPDCDKKDCPEFSRHPKKRTKIPGTNNYYEVADCVDTGMIDCFEKIQDGLNAYWDGLNCVTCKKDEVPDHKNAKCIKKTTPNPVSRKTCKDLYKGNTEAIACCEAGEKWENGKCECNDKNKVWDSTQKKCVENATSVSPCTQTDCKITISQSIKCRNNSNSFNSVQTYNICKEDLDKWNIADTNCPEFQKKVNGCQNLECIADLLDQVNAYKKAIAAVCEDSSAPVYVPTTPDNGAQINAAKSTISSFFSSAESSASVWKDKDGNFNTARLASDLTAGVVLGTVGGVVSGVVIKKKQVEKGFDALHCTGGGQTVADWGDIFNVGLRR